jgi:hypothetical protein
MKQHKNHIAFSNEPSMMDDGIILIKNKRKKIRTGNNYFFCTLGQKSKQGLVSMLLL